VKKAKPKTAVEGPLALKLSRATAMTEGGAMIRKRTGAPLWVRRRECMVWTMVTKANEYHAAPGPKQSEGTSRSQRRSKWRAWLRTHRRGQPTVDRRYGGDAWPRSPSTGEKSHRAYTKTHARLCARRPAKNTAVRSGRRASSRDCGDPMASIVSARCGANEK